MEAEKGQVKPVVVGEFPAQRFFDTLAAILSRREGLAITVKVTREEGKQEATA